MMRLDDKYFIDIDKFQFVLKRKEIVKSGERKGKDTFYDEGYYGYDLERLLLKYCHLQLNGRLPDNIADLIYAIKNLEDKVKEIGSSLKEEFKNNIDK